MTMKRTLFIAALLVALVGCDAQKPTTKSGETPTAPPSASTDAGGDKAAPVKAPTLADLPAELKHAGFEYYGLGHEAPVDMEISSSVQEGVVTGSQTTKLTEIKDGKAVFSVERTGGLARVGESDLTLEKDGIYVKSSSVMKVGPHDLEFPADVTPGKTWPSNMEVDMEGQKMKITSTNKIVGPTKVNTKAGSFDAILLTSNGSGVINGRKARIESSSWHVKGLGAVKVTFKTTYEHGKSESSVMQLTK